MKDSLIKYVRDAKTRRPIGVVTAINRGGEIHYGWSLCMKNDFWDKQYGLDLANARAVPATLLAISALDNKLPHCIAKEMVPMMYRARSYFNQF